MKPKEGEPFEDWCNRVKLFEHGEALKRLAKGDDPHLVMEEMANRMSAKMLHPIYKAIKESFVTEYDPEKSKREYEEKYLRYHTPVADHVVNEDLDTKSN